MTARDKASPRATPWVGLFQHFYIFKELPNSTTFPPRVMCLGNIIASPQIPDQREFDHATPEREKRSQMDQAAKREHARRLSQDARLKYDSIINRPLFAAQQDDSRSIYRKHMHKHVFISHNGLNNCNKGN
jgi:hypothetical protein